MNDIIFEKKNLLGIDIYNTKTKDLIKILEQKIDNNEKNILFGISAAAYGRLKFRPDLYSIYQKMDIIIAEGAGLPLFAKSFGINISEKIGMVNISYELLELANLKKYRVLFFGATQEVNSKVIEEVKSDYPNIHVCNGITGFFEESELLNIIKNINNEKPDILFIGITYPIKERFSVKYKEKLNTKLIVPCGGAFDVISKKVKKSKELSKRVPTAWIVRFIQEPRRLFKPIIITVLYSLFIMYPRLLYHHLCIAKNPSIADYFNIKGDEWDMNTGTIKGN